MSGKELPKVIDKSQADIDAAISAIQSCDLPTGTKDFAISCIRLAVWLPKALLGQKIKLSNLRHIQPIPRRLNIRWQYPISTLVICAQNNVVANYIVMSRVYWEARVSV